MVTNIIPTGFTISIYSVTFTTALRTPLFAIVVPRKVGASNMIKINLQTSAENKSRCTLSKRA